MSGPSLSIPPPIGLMSPPPFSIFSRDSAPHCSLPCPLNISLILLKTVFLFFGAAGTEPLLPTVLDEQGFNCLGTLRIHRGNFGIRTGNFGIRTGSFVLVVPFFYFPLLFSLFLPSFCSQETCFCIFLHLDFSQCCCIFSRFFGSCYCHPRPRQ